MGYAAPELGVPCQEIFVDEVRVRELLAVQFPEVLAASPEVRYLSEGEDHTMFLCGEWAWRFPKRPEVEGWLLREGPLLDAISPGVGVALPQFRYRGQPSALFPHVFMGYGYLPGESADLVKGSANPGFGRQVGRFLSALHAFPLAEAESLAVQDCREMFSPEPYLARVREAFPIVPGELSDGARVACSRFLAGVELPPMAEHACLVHGDLEAEHILLDPNDGRITGVIDWADACIAPPARDFAGLWAWGGDAFLDAMLATYAQQREDGFRERVRFMGKCFALLDYYEALEEDDAGLAFSLQQLEKVFRS